MKALIRDGSGIPPPTRRRIKNAFPTHRNTAALNFKLFIMILYQGKLKTNAKESTGTHSDAVKAPARVFCRHKTSQVQMRFMHIKTQFQLAVSLT
jgi:hypothetical protein